jgi:alkaline phosphatase D
MMKEDCSLVKISTMRLLTLIIGLLSLLAIGCAKKQAQNPLLHELVESLYDSTQKPFYHGVASGDPLADRVVIWTRVTPTDSVSKILVKWEVAEEVGFNSIYKSDTLSTSPLNDYTVKVDVDGLKPGRFYYYRFTALNKTSPTGRTKTSSASATDSTVFAVVSCSNWEFGYFNAYANIATREVDAVVHLGDYIYE